MIFQSFSHKRKTNLHRGPQTFKKTDSSETVLVGTIHMSHDFYRKPLPFLQILARGPQRELEQRRSTAARFSDEVVDDGGGEVVA